MRQVKRILINIPVLGNMLIKTKQTLRVRKDVQSLLNENHQRLIETGSLKKSLNNNSSELKNLNSIMANNDRELRERQELIQQSIEDLMHKLNNVKIAPVTQKDAPQTLFADNHALDQFYLHFENKFRGEESLISERLKVYIDRFKVIAKDSKKYPVVDLGSGRGEMLDLLKENDIDVIGVDLNEKMVKHAKSKGYKSVQSDALSYIKSLDSSSVSAITGFHLIEHLPFEVVVNLFQECHRVLRKNGFIIFETPNPENVDVATISFYMDPSHLKPLPPSLVHFLAESQGFNKVEIMRLHPQEYNLKESKETDELENHIRSRFTAPLDYSVIAYK